MALQRILSCPIVPEVLPSDSSGELFGDCVRTMRKHFNTTKMMKGKVRILLFRVVQ
jgi:hypothetical protein